MSRRQCFRSCSFTQPAINLSTLKVMMVSNLWYTSRSVTMNQKIFSDLDELVEHRRKINHVSVQKFDSNSQHVAHLRHNAEKYTEALKLFFDEIIDNKNAL